MKNDQKHRLHLLRLAADFIDRAVNSIIWFDSEGGIIHANKTACKRLSYTHDEILKMNMQNR